MDFSKFKPRLREYLQAKGIDASQNLIRCINPAHDDEHPSCAINDDSFKCFSCDAHGDIYDAVALIEGIGDKAEQFRFLENFFHDATPIAFATKKEACDFEIPPEIAKKIDDVVFSRDDSHLMHIADFLEERATKNTHGTKYTYPTDIQCAIIDQIGWWHGYNYETKYIDEATLDAAGITRKAWYHAGAVIKLGKGWKLHFFRDGKCEKRGSLHCATFPMFGDIESCKKVVLVEGEMDAIACRAAGFSNVFATGGVQGLTVANAKKYLCDKDEITIFFDSDEAGQRATQGAAAKLRKAGVLCPIKSAVLENRKDADEAICNGDVAAVEAALSDVSDVSDKASMSDVSDTSDTSAFVEGQCKTSTPAKVPKIPAQAAMKILQAISATIAPNIAKNRAIAALQNAVDDYQALKEPLRKAGVSEHQIAHPNEKQIPLSSLADFAAKYLSYYWQNKIKAILPQKSDKLHRAYEKYEPPFPMDLNALIETREFLKFFTRGDADGAASVCAKALAGRIIYSEDEKMIYVFDGNVWKKQKSAEHYIHDTLLALCDHYFALTPEHDEDDQKTYYKTEKLVGSGAFLTAVHRQFKADPLIWRENIAFDGTQISETLTLQDGVLDFSGDKIVFRESRADEYRKATLPYTIDEVRDATSPKAFLNFMKGNFTAAQEPKETLDTLLYYLSLVPSRNAQYKKGGIFIGVGNSGKTTMMKVIGEIYDGMTTPIPREMIMQNKDIRGTSSTSANPALADLEGMGAGISDESQKNDKLNAAMFKQLTGGGEMKARNLYSKNHVFKPTAQTIILSNYSPEFDNNDQALVNRLVVIPFKTEHSLKKGNMKREKDLLNELRPEYPAVVKFFAEKYISLKNEHDGEIPLSKEVQDYINDYVEGQTTDFERFWRENVVAEDGVRVSINDVYNRYLDYCDVERSAENPKQFIDKDTGAETDKQIMSRNVLTKFLKRDHRIIVKQHRDLEGDKKPVQFYENMRLKTQEEIMAEAKADEEANADAPQAPKSDAPKPQEPKAQTPESVVRKPSASDRFWPKPDDDPFG